MVNSIQVRLWFSYTLLVGLILATVTIGLFLSFRQSPVLYRQSLLQLRLAEAELSPQIRAGLVSGQHGQVAQLLQREAELRQIRFVLLRPNNTIQVDTGSADGAVFPKLPTLTETENQEGSKDGTVRDNRGRIWLYSQRGLGRGYTLFVSIIRPNLALRNVLSDEVVSPILWAGVIALILSVIIALIMANGITGPLKGIVAAAQSMAGGEYPSIPVKGPREIQKLAETLNEMSEKVQSSQQSQRDFVANVSHELKTPLTSIQGFSQAILDGTAQSPEMLQQAAKVIFNEANRMHRLVMDLLSLARLEAGTADLQRAQVDMSMLLNNVVDKFVLQAQQAEIHLVRSIPELPPCIGDADRLAQVFINLVDNAIKFTPSGGEILVGAELRENNLLVRVRDSGPGIPTEDQQRIFERFYQTDKSRRGGTGRGVGLGLAIAQQIILSHAGKIWVESKPNQGSDFFVQIPFCSPDDATLALRRPKG